MRGESSSMSSDRHGAADTADTSAAVAVGGGPIMMTGISPSGLPGWRPRRERISRHEFKYLSFWESRGADGRGRVKTSERSEIIELYLNLTTRRDSLTPRLASF